MKEEWTVDRWGRHEPQQASSRGQEKRRSGRKQEKGAVGLSSGVRKRDKKKRGKNLVDHHSENDEKRTSKNRCKELVQIKPDA
jgi:hypothetical protein